MNEWITILFCLFAAIGVARCIGWLLDRREYPRGLRRGYYVIPLYDQPAALEEQLRYGIRRLGWGRNGCGVALLVDMGLGEESAAVCERFVGDHPGLLYCAAADLPGVLDRLDAVYSPAESRQRAT